MAITAFRYGICGLSATRRCLMGRDSRLKRGYGWYPCAKVAPNLRGCVMKFRQLIVVSVISAFALSAQAAFVAGMTPAQIRAEIAVQQAAGSDVAAIVANASAAGLNMANLASVLVTVPGINASAAVAAMVRATPAAAAGIASAATKAAPQQAAAIASAATTAAPQQAVAIALAVTMAAPQSAAAINAAVIAAAPQAAAAVSAALQQAAAPVEVMPPAPPPAPIATPTTQTVCSVSCS